MESSEGKRVVMWGHLLLLAVIAAVVIAYLFDARAVSLRANNLLLVQPAAILALALVVMVIPQCFKRVENEDGLPAESFTDLGKVAVLAISFGLFAVSLERVGFDVATFVFMMVGLFVCGERRWWLVLVFSAVFTVLLIYGYGALIPFPFPLSVL